MLGWTGALLQCNTTCSAPVRNQAMLHMLCKGVQTVGGFEAWSNLFQMQLRAAAGYLALQTWKRPERGCPVQIWPTCERVTL